MLLGWRFMTKRADGLASKVLKVNHNLIKKDENGERYVPWCEFRFHFGVIKDESVCIQRDCEHYHKLYISAKNQYILNK